ncbi:MAG: peptide transporter [bacterium]
MKEDKELKEFRDLMQPPDHFESGFTWGTVLMALFVGLIMAPSQLYMTLVVGMGMGRAARWVTVILYVEIARRAFKKLKRPQIFILFYMCSAMMAMGGRGLLWRQFAAQSESLQQLGITDYLPAWYAPTDPAVLAERSFFHPAWVAPLGLMFLTLLISRLDHFGLGYVIYRITSDVEELPFPMAPVGAMGMTALADASDQRETWRWRVFSMGAALGIGFGAVYVAVPTVTGAIFSESIQIIPIPFVDLTNYTENILPAMPVLIGFSMGSIIAGMVLPFWAMMGAFIGLIITLIANPVLYHSGLLGSWSGGVGGIRTIQSNYMDFYFSFGLGLSLAVASIGFYHMYSSYRRKKREMGDLGSSGFDLKKLFRPPPTRGDIPLWVALLIYLGSTCTYIGLAYWLINYASGPLLGARFPLWLLVGYGFVYTPLMSYASARMEGIVGRQLAIPFFREATFILSGYKGAAIWFAPIPYHQYTQQVLRFRQAELTGTRFRSILKADILVVPIMFVGLVVFSQFILSISPVPSEMFPYANKFWELQAFQSGVLWSSTLPGLAESAFEKAFRWEYLVVGYGLAVLVYSGLAHFGLPVFLIYGVVRGLDQTAPQAVLPMFIGALLGRYFFRKRFGDNWPRYRIVFYAGFGAGMGLIAMFSLGFVLMSKSVIRLPV